MGGRGCALAGRRMSLADPRSESWLETAFRLLLAQHKVQPPTSQYVLRDSRGEHLARFDFAWPHLRLAVEVDGRRYHSGEEQLDRDDARSNSAGIEGWIVLRFSWMAIVNDPAGVLAQVRAALLQAAAR